MVGRDGKGTASDVRRRPCRGRDLKAIDHLSDWWGIAIVVTIGTLVWLGDMREDSDDVSAWAIVPGLVLGVFFGAAVADAWWGAVVGGIVLGFLFSFPSVAGPE